MAKSKVALTLAEQIERAREGRSQKYLIGKLAEAGYPMSESQFSRKKKGPDSFTEDELKALSEILETELVA